MSCEVDITTIAYGTFDPGVVLEIFHWTESEAEYNQQRKRASYFTVIPDPLLDGRVELSGTVQLETIRVWNLVRTTIDPQNFKTSHVFQANAAILNSGEATAAFELLEAQTAN